MSAIHWLSDIDGDFSTAADWSGGVVPGPSDNAFLRARGSDFTVTASVSETVNSIKLAANATLDITGGTFTARTGTGGGANAGTIIVGAGAGLDLGGILQNNGGIMLQGDGQSIASLLFASNTTLNGGGTVTLGENGVNMIDAAAGVGTVTLTNVDNTITGAGRVGFDSGSAQSLNVINQSGGVIETEGNPGYGLEFGAAQAGAAITTIINYGLIEARDGTNIQFSYSDVSGAGGTISAGQNLPGHVNYIFFTDCTIVGQTFSTESGSFIDIEDGSVTTGGNIQSGGSIGFLSSDLTLDENTTVSGGGSLAIIPLGKYGLRPVISGSDSSIVLTNVDDTIGGDGALGAGKLTLVNEAGGTIFNSGGKLTVDTGANTILNAGLISVTAGSCDIMSPIDNTGVLATSRNLAVHGAVTGTGDATIGGGTLDFASSFNQDVTFTGTTGVLVLAQSLAYTASVTGFSTTGGTSLDLKDINFVSANEATFSGTSISGVLTVTDGTHTAHITLIGDYLGSTFTCSEDSHGGTIVVDPAGPPATAVLASPHALASAMAALAPAAAAAGASWGHPDGIPLLTLAVSRGQLA